MSPCSSSNPVRRLINVTDTCIVPQLAARDQPLAEEDALSDDEFTRRRSACTVFLGYTSNMSSAGVRDTIRFLVQHSMVRLRHTTDCASDCR